MIDVFFILILVLVVIQSIATLAYMYFSEKDRQNERKDLYDRLQAGTLQEYKVLAQVKPREKETKETVDRPNFV